ncbi:MAG: hypothetical protein M3280_09850 [Actinomycetota bacterium]|nr:hypothetical protein [Actinomycetota bacterium]
MRIAVEAWSPEYGGELDLGGPEELTTADVKTDCEDRTWAPVDPADAGDLCDRPLAFIDGTRRIDARLFVTDNGGAPTPGVAGSVGVGAVGCDPAPAGVNGRKSGAWWKPKGARIVAERVDRYLAVGGGLAAELSAGAGLEYRSLPVPGFAIDELVHSVHNAMRTKEAEMAQELAATDHLVFVDGPLAVMRAEPLPMVGFIKAHHRRYLESEQEQVIGDLGCGQRTPLFAFGEPRHRYSWYLRLCEPEDDMHGWHGIVRAEAPAAIPLEDAVRLADASASLLPAFASLPFWDARAPQNLVPVTGLERRLHHLLGERDLVYRMVRSAAMRVNGSPKDAKTNATRPPPLASRVAKEEASDRGGKARQK